MFDSPCIFSAFMRIDRHASSADNCPNDDGDSHPEQYTAASHRNTVTDGYPHTQAEV